MTTIRTGYSSVRVAGLRPTILKDGTGSLTLGIAMKDVFVGLTGPLEIQPGLIKGTLTGFFLKRRGLESDAC